MDTLYIVSIMVYLIPIIPFLSATIYYYITTKRFNKNGIVTYGEIVKYELAVRQGYNGKYYNGKVVDCLHISFNLENQEHTSIIVTRLPFSRKKLKEKFAIGSKKKIKVLKSKKGTYEARLIKEDKENASYQLPIILAIITILFVVIPAYFFLRYVPYEEKSLYFFLEDSTYKENAINNGNNNIQNEQDNSQSNNPYIEKFATINDETIESMNTKFGVQGQLENPSISQASYVWEIKDGMKIKGTINSEGKIRSVELEAQDDEFYDSNVKFASDISALNGKSKLTYEDCKAKCGGVDGTPTRISNGKVNTYVWVNSEYKFTITIGSSGYVTSTILKPR